MLRVAGLAHMPDIIDCHKCKHYYVTWDKNFPHAYHVLEFKGYEFPSSFVYKSSGIHCLMFKLENQMQQFKHPKDASNSKL